jgi:hypothetical protein
MEVLILISIAIISFCNSILFLNLDRYLQINRGIEVNASGRREAEIYRSLSLVVVGISIFCANSWWPGIVGYVIGWIVSMMVASPSNENIEAYIIFFGKFLKPIFLIVSLIAIFA